MVIHITDEVHKILVDRLEGGGGGKSHGIRNEMVRVASLAPWFPAHTLQPRIEAGSASPLVKFKRNSMYFSFNFQVSNQNELNLIKKIIIFPSHLLNMRMVKAN